MDKSSKTNSAAKSDKEELVVAAPGGVLASARNKMGRTLDDIAEELNISKDHLEAIEDNQFTSQGGSVYTKGYIRAYARSLGLEAQPLLDAISDHQVDEPTPNVKEKVSYDQRSGLLGLVGAALFALVAVAVLTIWVMGDQSEGVQSENETVVANLSDAGRAAALPEVQQDELQGQWIEEAPPLENDEAVKVVQQALLTPGLNATEEVEKKLDQALAEKAVVRDQISIETETVKTPTPKPEPKPTPKPEPEPEPALSVRPSAYQPTLPETDTKPSVPPVSEVVTDDPVQIGSGSDQIKLLLSEDSWVEIQDSSGAILLQGLYNAGASRAIRGSAPFQIFLGNAPGVSINFNGTFFDSTSYIRGNNTARFALVN